MSERKVLTSVDIGRIALKLAITSSRPEEQELRQALGKNNIAAVAVDFGGEFAQSIVKIVERAVVASQRQNVIAETHISAGAVAGAVHEALSQVVNKALGFNVGGKIGIARYGEHLCVAVYMGIGVLNLNELAVGLAHRCLPQDA